MHARPQAPPSLPHAFERVPHWAARWHQSGGLVLLLDFDGTLAPIVERPERAQMLPSAREALRRLLDGSRAVSAAIVSGRGLADARERAALPGVPYAGNHGMEIEGPGVHRVHAEAAAARPALERVRSAVEAEVRSIPGALVEDKGLTLSVHFRLVDRARVGAVRDAVLRAVAGTDGLRTTEGKEVLEVRPAVEWDKGRAVRFLLEHFRPAPGVPVLYLGDDTTDEDAFRALRGWHGGEGVVVGDPPPPGTAATSFVRGPEEVADLLRELAEHLP